MSALILPKSVDDQPIAKDDFSMEPELKLAELIRVHDPVPVFEGIRRDSDGAVAFIYTVGGVLDGEVIWPPRTVEGDVMIIHARDRNEADEMAADGLETTIKALRDKGVDRDGNAGIITAGDVRPKAPH